MSRVENIEICKALEALQMQKIDHHHENGLTFQRHVNLQYYKVLNQSKNTQEEGLWNRCILK